MVCHKITIFAVFASCENDVGSHDCVCRAEYVFTSDWGSQTGIYLTALSFFTALTRSGFFLERAILLYSLENNFRAANLRLLENKIQGI